MSDAPIFNRSHIRLHRARAAPRFTEHAFLFSWCEKQMLDRLSEVKKTFASALYFGGRISPEFLTAMTNLKTIETIAATDFLDHRSEMLDAAPQSADLVVSVLDLHTLNDLPGALAQIKSALKPDGLFLGCLLGGETLYELRETLMQAEIALNGGASPRVAPFADKQQMGALLQRAGFALPVVDSEIVRVSYRSVFNLMADLRGMGENNALHARRKNFTPSSFFAKADAYYRDNFFEDDGRVTASFEIIFLIGWSPHESQQKPLRRGSAQHELADFLK